MSSTISIRSFEPGDEIAFRALNEAWIEKLFALEEKDRATLGDPHKYVLAPGGRILMALDQSRAVGCCALLHLDGVTVELGKMAVDESYRGRGIGRLLMAAAVSEARGLHAERIYLETNSALLPAIALYEAFGFTGVPPERQLASTFARVDLPMELRL